MIDNRLWTDVRIYFNGKTFDTYNGENYYYNDPDRLVTIEELQQAIQHKEKKMESLHEIY